MRVDFYIRGAESGHDFRAIVERESSCIQFLGGYHNGAAISEIVVLSGDVSDAVDSARQRSIEEGFRLVTEDQMTAFDVKFLAPSVEGSAGLNLMQPADLERFIQELEYHLAGYGLGFVSGSTLGHESVLIECLTPAPNSFEDLLALGLAHNGFPLPTSIRDLSLDESFVTAPAEEVEWQRLEVINFLPPTIHEEGPEAGAHGRSHVQSRDPAQYFSTALWLRLRELRVFIRGSRSLDIMDGGTGHPGGFLVNEHLTVTLDRVTWSGVAQPSRAALHAGLADFYSAGIRFAVRSKWMRDGGPLLAAVEEIRDLGPASVSWTVGRAHYPRMQMEFELHAWIDDSKFVLEVRATRSGRTLPSRVIVEEVPLTFYAERYSGSIRLAGYDLVVRDADGCIVDQFPFRDFLTTRR